MVAASEKQVEALTRQMEQMQQMMAALQQGANPPPTGEVYGYDKRHGREAAWDVVQRHEMVASCLACLFFCSVLPVHPVLLLLALRSLARSRCHERRVIHPE